MKRIISAILAILILTTLLTACSFDYIYSKPRFKHDLDYMVMQHENVLGKDKMVQKRNMIAFPVELSYYGDETSMDVHVTIDIDEYTYQMLGYDAFIIQKDGKIIALVRLTEKVNKDTTNEQIQEYFDFSINSEHEWKCYKASIDEGQNEIFIFKNTTVTENYTCDLEISGYDIKDLERIISACDSRLTFYVNYDMLFG